MSNAKRRVTVTLDAGLVEAASKAVASGSARSLSAWVNEAIAAKFAHEQRLKALVTAISDYESEFGEITPEEMEAQEREDRESAIRVTPKARRASA